MASFASASTTSATSVSTSPTSASAASELSVTPPSQISKDIAGPDNPIPLSPQWLLPKPGDNKAGAAPGENRPIPSVGYDDHSDVIKSPGNGDEMHGSQKKKDVFRPTFLDMDSVRRDRWRDEERDTNLFVRKDCWREGDKEIGDIHKTDRWVDNSPARHSGEARRAPADKWADSSRETDHNQRRESKWTRWGPGDKEMDKWTAAGKYNDASYDKGHSHLSNPGKDGKESDRHRPWRPSSLQGRGRADPPHHHSQTTGKEISKFIHSRGRGDKAPSTFSAGRGRVVFGAGSINNHSSHSESSDFMPERGDNGVRELTTFKYSRTKLLDILRLIDLRSSTKVLGGVTQVPSLTQEEPLEPLALCVPTPEESAILKGIDKGDIVSSGAPQISKDGSSGQSSVDFATSRQTKLGSTDVSSAPDDMSDKVDNVMGAYSKVSECLPSEKKTHPYGSNVTMSNMDNHQRYTENKYSVEAVRDDDAPIRRGDAVFNNRDTFIKGHASAQSDTPWRPASVVEPPRTPSGDCFDVSSDIHLRTSDMSWSHGQKDRSNGWNSILPDPSYGRNELKWQGGEDSTAWKHSSVVVYREVESGKLLQPSPEDLLLYYKDPQGLIQGPFSGSDIIGWFEAGYFGIDLQVRLASAPNESPFLLLGDVMPHLRAKARPPPGFNTAKQTDVIDVPNKLCFSGFANTITGGVDLIGNERRHAHGSSVEAENRFLESLMSGEIRSSPLERSAVKGLQGFNSHISTGMPIADAESGEALSFLAKRMNLERPESLSNPYPYWPPRDAAPVVVPGPNVNRNSDIPQANLLSSIADAPRQSHPQTVEMMSVLQGLSDRSSAGMNNGPGDWPNLHGGSESFKNKIDGPYGQNFPQAVYGSQQHNLQPLNQPSFTNLLGQTSDSQGMLTEKLLSSGLVQDPQLLNLLQQQYLLQLQSQQSVAGPHLSMLDWFLLLQQQQKQEEQQKLQQQQLLQHQQQLLSKALSEQQHVQRLSDISFGQLQASVPVVGNAPTDNPAPQLLNHLFQVNSQVCNSGLLDDRNTNAANMPLKDSQDLSRTVPSEGSSSLHLPHQMFGGLPKGLSSVPEHANNEKFNNLSLGSVVMENFATSEAMEKFQSAISTAKLTSVGQTLQSNSEIIESALGSVYVTGADCKSSTRANENEVLKSEVTNDAELICTGAFEESPTKECNDEVSAVKDAKIVESRELKKTSEKKSRKQKSSKAQQSTDQVMALSKGSSVPYSKQSSDGQVSAADQSEVAVAAASTLTGAPVQKNGEVLSSQDELLVSANLPSGASESDAKGDQSTQVNSAQRAWKPAVSVKPKSLLEIQQEEQQKAQMETPVFDASPDSLSLSTPWAGVVAYTESKSTRENHPGSSNTEYNMGMWESSRNKKSGLHNLLAAECLAKSSERNLEISDMVSSLPPLPTMSTQLDIADDANFIEAKDTKKSRKKAAKAKGATAKASMPADLTIASSPVEKGKSSKPVQAEKEVLPAPPSGPSLGDFVPWKEESTSPSPAPAWLSEPAESPKPTSLRDILREQEKKVTPVHSQISTPQKPQSTQTRGGSRSVLASAFSKAAAPVKIPSDTSSQSKSKGDDDLFWGPPEQSKQTNKQADFPQLGNHGGRVTKSTPVKGTSGASLSRQKSGSRASQHHASSTTAPAQISAKGERDGGTKNSEAVDFRDWCESESVRLTGSRDTSFLEFCSKQTKSEAETLLKENLGSFDRNHEFIEKFLNYMEMLPSDVLEVAFQSRNDLKAYNNGASDMISDYGGIGDLDTDSRASADGSAKGGKKKGKKGKKVSPSVLGFNVVSNRIMMGEIQTLED